MKTRHAITLIIITLLAIGLRFYKLGEIPSGVHRDEAFLGYNAFSILKTGRDISGNILPVHLASFLYSPAGYSYVSLPPIAIFGLNAFSVRFASALFGALTIPFVYLLTQALLPTPIAPAAGLIASALLTISPWHINLSRTATENVPVVFLLTVGTWLLTLWLKKRKLVFFLLAFFCYVETLFLYQAPRAFLPLLLPLVLIGLLKQDKKSMRIGLMMTLVIIIIPTIWVTFSPTLSLRMRSVSIFGTPETQLVVDSLIREDGVRHTQPVITRVFHNKISGYLSQFLRNYFAHFSYDFLFTDRGLPDRYRVVGVGILYLFELPLILAGLHSLVRKKTATSNLLLLWFVLSPIGSALAFDDVPNLQRTLLIYPALSIIEAVGVIALFAGLKKYSLYIAFPSIFLVTLSIFSYLHQYFVHSSLYQPWYRHSGYEELVKQVNAHMGSYKKIIITNHESAPTIFFAFYSQFDPLTFQKQTIKNSIQPYDRINFATYEFIEEACPLREIIAPINNLEHKTLVTGEKDALYVNFATCKNPPGAHELYIITRSDGSEVFRILEYIPTS